MEKPVAVDPVGVRSVIESAKIAKQKNLAAMAGTQKRHQYNYLDIMKKIHDGDIGELVAGQCYFTTGELIARHRHVRQPDWSDMEWQCRNWYYFTWLSGDHLVEQAIHEIDAINWAFNDFPVKAMAIGGRQNRKGIEFGHIFDHFAVEYEYANGARTICMARQADGCSDRISDRLVGTKGTAYFDRGNGFIKGLNPYTYNGPSHNPQEQEHADLVASIRAGNPLNDAERIAKSTLTAIMGRMSAYTGRELSFKWALNASKLDLTPPKYDWIDLPMPEVAVPGKTKLI
jgi:predicted dehydrogenase